MGEAAELSHIKRMVNGTSYQIFLLFNITFRGGSKEARQEMRSAGSVLS